MSKESKDAPISREEAIEILKAGKVEEWNDLREKYPNWRPELSTYINPLILQNSNLNLINLDGCNLFFANFEDTSLKGANFAHAILYGTNFQNVNLSD